MGFIKTIDHQPTQQPLTTYSPTQRPPTHKPTHRLLSTYLNIEDQTLNMFYIL